MDKKIKCDIHVKYMAQRLAQTMYPKHISNYYHFIIINTRYDISLCP